jgi:hypothetical protein
MLYIGFILKIKITNNKRKASVGFLTYKQTSKITTKTWGDVSIVSERGEGWGSGE